MARIASTVMTTALILGLASAAGLAQTPAQPGAAPQPAQQNPQPSPPKPYKPVSFTLPAPVKDASFDKFRTELGAIAEKKDKAALAKLVVAKDFFWMRENGDGADKAKSGIDNLAAAVGLDDKDGGGWELLFGLAQEQTMTPMAERKGVSCAPAGPKFDDAALEKLTQETQTDFFEWGYPVKNGLEVRAKGDPKAPVQEKLGMIIVRVMFEDTPAGTDPSTVWTKVVPPSGKVGFVEPSSILPLSSDQICYVKEGANWRIAGYVGGGEQQ